MTHEEALRKARDASQTLAQLGLPTELDDAELEDVAQALMSFADLKS